MRNSRVVPRLVANFAADLVSIARQGLAREWPQDDISAIKDCDILSYLFDSPRRRLGVRKRSVLTSDIFCCPQAYLSGWDSLKTKIAGGQDFGPHLSLRHQSLLNNDGLLNEWGVHHFHLGEKPYAKNPHYVERTGPIVLAIVAEEIFYAIAVYDHESKPWSNIDIIETIHRNWPVAISQWQVKGLVPEPVTQQQRDLIRPNGGQTVTGTSDGLVYGSIGGLTSATGLKFESNRQADMFLNYVNNLQEALANNLQVVVPYLEQNGYNGQDQVEARFMVVENGYRAHFPQYGVLATLTFEVIDKEGL